MRSIFRLIFDLGLFIFRSLSHYRHVHLKLAIVIACEHAPACTADDIVSPFLCLWQWHYGIVSTQCTYRQTYYNRFILFSFYTMHIESLAACGILYFVCYGGMWIESERAETEKTVSRPALSECPFHLKLLILASWPPISPVSARLAPSIARVTDWLPGRIYCRLMRRVRRLNYRR